MSEAIEIECLGGDDLRDVCKRLCYLAKAEDLCYKANFNGFELYANRHSEPWDLAGEYHMHALHEGRKADKERIAALEKWKEEFIAIFNNGYTCLDTSIEALESKVNAVMDFVGQKELKQEIAACREPEDPTPEEKLRFITKSWNHIRMSDTLLDALYAAAKQSKGDTTE